MSGSHPGRYILEEHQGGAALADDPAGVGHRSVSVAPGPLVGVAGASPGVGVGLAGQASDNQIDMAPERSSVESFETRPDRRVVKASGLDVRDQKLDGRSFPLTKQEAASIRAGDPDSEVDASDAGAQADVTQSGR